MSERPALRSAETALTGTPSSVSPTLNRKFRFPQDQKHGWPPQTTEGLNQIADLVPKAAAVSAIITRFFNGLPLPSRIIDLSNSETACPARTATGGL